MVLGIPPIACATDGAREIITNGVDGLLVRVGDHEDLAEAILKLIEDPALRQRLGAKAQIKARQFDAPRIAQRYGALFEQIVS